MKRAHFTVADIRRAVKAVESGGKTVTAVDFPKEGGFRVLIAGPANDDVRERSGGSDWDEVLAR